MSLTEEPLPSTVSEKMRKSNRITVKNLPLTISKKDAFSLVSAYGVVKSFSLITSPSKCYLEVLFESSAVAWKAYESLQNFVYQDHLLQVELFVGINNPKTGQSSGKPNSSETNFNSCPLRILVPANNIGAIIGKKGQTIKLLTTKCKARIDVHEENYYPEKIIEIYGQMGNRTMACKEILRILEQQNAFTSSGDACLKMLANDHHCGRLIGKQGRNISKIKQDTGTRIVVASMQDMASLFPYRVISINGSIDDISAAQSAISLKLFQFLEADANKIPSFSNFGGLTPFYMPANPNQGFLNPMMMPAESCNLNMSNHAADLKQRDVCQVCIPNSAVGSMIGIGGANMKHMMKSCGAHITVEPKPMNIEMTPSTERIVTIKGSTDCCWKGCYLVFEKMRMEGFSGIGEAHLKTILKIPKLCVSRVIGKAGSSVRMIQKESGAIIRTATDDDVGVQLKPGRRDGNFELQTSTTGPLVHDVPLEISGNFHSVQIKALIPLIMEHMRMREQRGSAGGGYPRRFH